MAVSAPAPHHPDTALAGADPDVSLDLQAVFTGVYNRAGYDYAIDYKRVLRPVLSEPEAVWAKQRLTEIS